MKQILALCLWLAMAASAIAQGCGPQNPNCIVPTAPPGTNDNRAASTAFVNTAVGGGGTFNPSVPYTWTAPQTFTMGITANRYISGLDVASGATVSMGPQTPSTDFGQPAFYFNDLTMGGASFPDASTHIAFSIIGNKSPTTGVPNGTGSYQGLNTSQYCSGVTATGYCTGALLQAIGVYNTASTTQAGRFFGSNSQVQVPSATIADCPTCGPLTVNEAAGQEIDLFVNQPVIVKEGVRIVDLSSPLGTSSDTHMSAGINILKGNPAPGWPIGININSNWNGTSYSDAGYPIQAGGRAITSTTSTLQLACFLCIEGMAGGFNQSAIVFPPASVAVPISRGMTFGGDGSGGQIVSGTSTNGGAIEFANNLTVFTFAGTAGTGAAFIGKGTTDGQIGIWGTGTGYTVLNTANTGASVFTVTLPAVTGTALVSSGTVAPGAGNCPSGTVGGKTVAGCATVNIGGVARQIPFF